MKNLIRKLTILGLLAFFITSCQQEEFQNELDYQEDKTSLMMEQINQNDFKYQHEVIIESGDKKHYVKYRVSSNDKVIANSMANQLGNAELGVLDNLDIKSKGPTPIQSNEDINVDNNIINEEVAYDFEKGVHIVEIDKIWVILKVMKFYYQLQMTKATQTTQIRFVLIQPSQLHTVAIN